ncbi:glutathione S-transferase [Favolaschia claudopus]|uniref:glutathione transferase n=1 Tax=Favolaschia claudopus TaxID=2862362 RepID=A0AAW0DZF0_9AGAR
MVVKFYASSVPIMGSGKATVALTLIEKQIPFEFISVDLDAKEHKTPEFMAMNPFGLVPVINDDGFVVYESRAICKYLEEKYPGQGTSLLPKELEERTKVEQAISVETTAFFPAVAKAGTEALLKPSRGLPVDHSALDESLQQISDCLDAYEVQLAKHKYLAGDDFTLADLFHYAGAQFLEIAGIDIVKDKGPNVKRWWSELLSRPTWVKLLKEGIKETI